MKKLSGYIKIVVILIRIYVLFGLQYLSLACKRMSHRLIELN